MCDISKRESVMNDTMISVKKRADQWENEVAAVRYLTIYIVMLLFEILMGIRELVKYHRQIPHKIPI